MVASIDKTNFKPNVQDLQSDVVDCLEKIVELMGRARDISRSDRTQAKSGDDYERFQQDIKKAIHNVKHLELRMAVVAPMKAGKSTIINAIVGQDLLPSRNAAMTTLPTEIIFKDSIEEPVLVVTEDIKRDFENTIVSLKSKIQEYGQEEIKEKTAQYPHLLELLKAIELAKITIDSGRYSGYEKITKTLTELNDIVRLCSVIEPTKNLLKGLWDIPRLETPFLNYQEDEYADKLGNLVIIDTPGPNEAGENLKLTDVVADQLERSSIVLIVLDFTQLNNQAAEGVKKQVEPVINLIGKDNLYVLVNKIDQRRKKDMSPEQVKEFVYADLGLSESSQTERVFEISAIQAFAAAKYLSECQKNSHLDPEDNATKLRTAEILAREIYGTIWEEELEDLTIKDLQKKAKKIWKKSGFGPFLEKAISALMESAAPRCMLSALNLSRSLLLKITDNLKIRNSAIAKNEKELREKIEELEADLKRLELCQTQLKEVDRIKYKLQEDLGQKLKLIKQNAEVSIEDYFGEENYQRANLLQKIDTKTKEFVVGFIPSFDPFKLAKKIKRELKAKSSKMIEFNSRREADDFVNEAIAWAKDRAETLLNSSREYAKQEIDKSRRELRDVIKQEAMPIIDKARKRLNKEFNIELSLPNLPNNEYSNISQPQISVDRSTRKKTVKRSENKRRWYTIWLWKTRHTWEETIDAEYYSVSLDSLINKFNDSLNQSVENINRGIIQYLDEDFKEKIEEYFDYLDRYLCDYRDSLRQAQQDQKLSLEDKKRLTEDLDTLIPEASNYVEKVNNYIDRTQTLMPKEHLNDENKIEE